MRPLIATVLLTLASAATVYAQPVPLPGVEVVSEGCSPCSAGGNMLIALRVWRPGVAIDKVEVRASIKTPDGSIIRLPVSGTILTLPSGLSSLTILDTVVGGDPSGVYVIEGAILNPDTGVTLDRRSLAIVKP